MLKRIKRLFRRRNNGGFTLVEVIVASALLGVLLLGVFGFVQPVLRSVRAKEQNARAVMLCETVESYIANSIKYAYYVQAFSGVTSSDVSDSSGTASPLIVDKKYTGSEFPENADCSLNDMLDCLKNKLGTENYEVRCIGMRWLSDNKTGDKKLMLTNELVDQNTLALDLTKTKRVFEECFYDGLYPVLYFNNYNNQYQVLDASGNLVNKYEDDEVKIAPAIEITMDIYLDPMCYSVDETTRNSAMVSFVGTTYQDFRNISSTNTINKAGNYKVLPSIEMNSYNDAYAANAGAAYTDDEVGECYYTDTFIYYIARKTKTTTSGSSGSSGSTPSSSSSSDPTSSTP